MKSLVEKSVLLEVLQYVINALKALVSKKVDDAPADGANYVRKDNKWVKAPEASEPVEYATAAEIEEQIKKFFESES